MTKSVRIVNADTSDFVVRIKVQRIKEDGTWEDTGEFTEITHPAGMSTQILCEGKRLIIEEAGTSGYQYKLKE